MKKQLFLVACAALALASCSEKETVDMPKDAAINFGNTFVGNATRVGVDDSSIRSFYVFGGHANSYTNDFNNVEVRSDDGTSWTYTPARYWTEANDYVFNAYAVYPTEKLETAAVADGGNGVEFTDFVADGEKDLIVAEKVERTVTDADIASQGEVQFTFNHILSMIKLTFESEFHDNVKLTVSDITLKQVPNKGSWSNSAWTISDAESKQDYVMGDVADLTSASAKSSSEIIVMPQHFDTGFTVEFKVKAEYADGTGVIVDGTKTLTATLPDKDWSHGNRYNYVAKLNIENIDPDNDHYEIKFGDPTVEPWAPYSDADITVGQ